MSALQPQNKQGQNPSKTPSENPLDILQAQMNDDMVAVNQMIIQHMQSDVALIPQLANYLIAAGGKRIRPLLTLSCTALFEGETRSEPTRLSENMTRAHKLAAAVEFIHTATLLHDDVVDDSDERRGKPSANIAFGNEASVLVGDFLFSRAFQLMVADGNLDVLRILSNASAIIAEGEVMQLSVQNNIETTMEEYAKVIEGKTASLFAAACEVGPIIANQGTETVQALRNYGLNLGMAFQVIDDVLDYSSTREKIGKAVGDDFREGKMTAPVIFAIQKANGKEKEFWQRTLGDKKQNEGDLEKAQNFISQHDALAHGMKLAHQYGDKAIKNLNMLPDTPLKQTLVDLVSFTINREY